MQYRQDKISGNKLSILGLGCMRFSMSYAATEQLVLEAIERGINFFDTAYLYPNSEKLLGEILAQGNKRQGVYLGTKLPLLLVKSAADFDKFFDIQLKRLKTDYIDYYYLHNLTSYAHWQEFVDMGLIEWIEQKKAAGQIKQIGFSFHGTSLEFIKILDAYNWEFCMIQYNYYDEDYQAGRRGLAAAAKKGLSVFVMEPLLGGRLVTGLPKKAIEAFNRTNPELAPVDWAFWWLWSHEECITAVFSGMNSAAQLRQNTKSAFNYRALTAEEIAVFDEVVKLLKKGYKMPCNNCNYCLPCPRGVNIPACITAYNTSFAQGYKTGISYYLTSTNAFRKDHTSPRLCNACVACEMRCPQAIQIRVALKKVLRRFEFFPINIALKIARRVIGGKG